MYSISSAPNTPSASSPVSSSPVFTTASLAHSLKQALNAKNQPCIRLEDVPEQYRPRFSFLRTAGAIAPLHPLDRVLSLESKRFALLLNLKSIKSLTRTSRSTCAAAHRVLRHAPPWPVKRNALFEAILGDDYRAFCEYRHLMFAQPGNTFSVRSGPPEWPRTHLEIHTGVCSLESPKGNIQAEFNAQAKQIQITFSGRKKIVAFDDARRLALCGIGVPQKWKYEYSFNRDPQLYAVYATPHFQPVVLSPDERSLFCILEKDSDVAVLQKIQEESSEQIALPPELRITIRDISGMASNASGSVFIYCGYYGEQKLHIWENGHWSRLDLYRPGPSGNPAVNHSDFFISAVSSEGDLVLTSHDPKVPPRLLKRKIDTCGHEGRYRKGCADAYQWWKLPVTGDNDRPAEPFVFAFSPAGTHLAYSPRNLGKAVARENKTFILDLRQLSPASMETGCFVPSLYDFHRFGCTFTMNGPTEHRRQHSIDPNHLSFSFSDSGLSLTKAIYDADTDTVTSYTAGMRPSTVLQPLFDPAAKRITAEIARLKTEAEAEPASSQNQADKRPSAHFPSPSNSSPSA